jgi:hypothetical protein
MNKIPTAAAILIGVGVVAVLAGFNDQLGKVLMVFMIIVAFLWLIGGGTQTDLAKWTSMLGGTGAAADATTAGLSLI